MATDTDTDTGVIIKTWKLLRPSFTQMFSLYATLLLMPNKYCIFVTLSPV